VAPAADAMRALGQVDHLKVERKCSHQVLGVRRLGAQQQWRQSERARVSFTPRNSGPADVLDLGQECGALLLGQDLSDQRPKASNVIPQWLIGAQEVPVTNSVHSPGA
jgi:hypothetical protein